MTTRNKNTSLTLWLVIAHLIIIGVGAIPVDDYEIANEVYTHGQENSYGSLENVGPYLFDDNLHEDSWSVGAFQDYIIEEESIFLDAAARGDTVAVESLISEGRFTKQYGYGLETAAQNGHLPVVEQLVSLENVDESQIGKALELSSENGHLPVVEFLKDYVESFISPIKNMFYGQALEKAAEGGHLDIVMFLLTFLEDPRGQWIGISLMQAAKNGHMPVIQNLVPIIVIDLDHYSGMSLIKAASSGKVNVVEYFVNDLGVNGEFCGRALVSAVQQGHLQVVKFLVDAQIVSQEFLRQGLKAAKQCQYLQIEVLLSKALS